MYQFIETICYEHGLFRRLDLHNERCNRTRLHFFGLQPDIRIELHLAIPPPLINETVKCTLTYGIDILSIEYVAYKIRPLNSLQIVVDDTINYAFKYADRSGLTKLLEKRGQDDDILIVKNGLLTDISYANIIYLYKNKWYSQQNPLLFGTRLQHYLKEGRITPALLTPEDLPKFTEARIINAMISIEESPVIPVNAIHF